MPDGNARRADARQLPASASSILIPSPEDVMILSPIAIRAIHRRSFPLEVAIIGHHPVDVVVLLELESTYLPISSNVDVDGAEQSRNRSIAMFIEAIAVRCTINVSEAS